jgi:TP901 family phage tail tape measure protein
MSRIDLQIVGTANFAQVEASIARLKSQIAALNTMSLMSPVAAKNMQSTFANALTASGMWQARMVGLTSETEKFGRALERGNLRGMQYFRAGSEYLRKQQGQVRALAKEQVRMQQTRGYGFGDGRAVAVTPRGIDEAIHKQQILNQQHRIFRQVVQGGATQLINWGKNTQWAGRQLTVGLTVPLTIFGSVAAKMFMDVDKQLTRMAKVYGDATKGVVNSTELEKIRSQVSSLAQELASSMGVAAAETAGIAADIAATGVQGEELLASTREAMRLSVLGEVDRQEAMRATLAIQSVFKKDTEGLTESINLLNAVENQTSTTLNDLVEGVVKAGPVVQGLGGSIEDLALMMVAMREGGIPASEAANAIKSSLASLINPTKQTTQVLGDFGVNIKDIVDRNAGNVIGTLVDLQDALSGLDDLSRQRSIEQIFGKFQFSRINALLSNINRAGSQTQQVMEIAEMSTIQLAKTAEAELTTLTESASMKFTRAVEGLKASLIPVGEFFLNIGTFLIGGFKGIMDAFNNLAGPLKTFLGGLGIFVAILGPLIMITGVLGNFLGYLVKMAAGMMAIRKGARGVFEHYNAESVAAQKLTELVSTKMYDEAKATNVLKAEIDKLTASLATMASQMGAVASGFGAMGAAATTAAGAARGALVASMGPGSVSRWLSAGGKNAGATGLSRGRTFAGPEFSHLIPESSLKGTGLANVQTIGTLVHGQSAAAAYQKAMNDRFRPTAFYDPAQGQSRTQILAQMAASSNSQRALDITRQSGFETSAARLLPTREEYNTYVAKYHASLRSLIDLGKVRLQSLSEQIATLTMAGNIEGAEKLLISAIQENSKSFDLYYQAELNNISRVDGALDRVVMQAATDSLALEQKLAATAPRAGFRPNAGGDSMMRLISASAGGGTAAGDPNDYRRPLSPVEQRLLTAKKKYEQSITAADAAERATVKIERERNAATTSVAAAEKELATISSSTKRALQNWTRVVDENGKTFWENSQTQKRLSITGEGLSQKNQQLVKNLERLSAVQLRLELAHERLAAAEQKYETVLKLGPNAIQREIQAKEELAAAEKALAAETNKAKLAMIRQIYKGSMADIVGTGKDRAAITAALKRLEPAILAETASIHTLTKDNQKFITLMDAAGQAFAVLNMTTKELIAVEEMLANGFKMSQLTGVKEKFTRERLIQEMTEEAQKHNASQTQIDFLTRRINMLSNEVLETMTSFEVTKTALGRLKLVIDQAGAKLAAMTTPVGTAAKGVGTGVMGASMAAGMGMMFLPHDGGAGSKIAGGALMGASMGGMMGMMSANPFVAVAGLLGGAALGAAVPAIGAMTGAAKETRDALTKYSEALNGSSLIIDKFSKELGILKPSDKLAAEIGQVQTAGETLAEGQQLLETETGKQLLDIAKQFSGTELVDALRNQLKQLTLLEIFTPEQAKAVAQRLALELGQPVIGKALVNGINEVLDENGNLISDNVAKIFAETVPEFDFNLPNYTRDNPVTGQQPGGYTPASDEFIQLERFATDNVPFIVSSLAKLREAQALTVKEFMDGELTYEQYSEQMSKIREENEKAADALLILKNAGVKVTDMIKDIAIAGGLEEEFVNAENAAKEFMGRLNEEMDQSIFGTDMERSTFYTQIQIAAAYGDITESEVRSLLALAEDPNQKATLTTIFSYEGAQENAVEIIKLINSGIKPEFIVKIQSNAEEMGTSLNDLYASLVALSKLPDQIQTKVTADIMNSPELLKAFIDNYEYAMSLPDSNKELKAEVFGNEDLDFFERNWDALLQLPSSERKTAVFEYMVTGSYNFNTDSIPAPTEVTELTSPDVSALMSSFDSGGGGGGGSDAANEAIDKKIKQQDKIIAQIQKEREERQKLLELEKKALDFAMQQQDLESQIMIAKAEGRIADAALLQSQLDANTVQEREDEKERLRQEAEDKRIRAAERRKKQLEKQKEDSSGGGSGGGGGMSEEARAAIEASIQFLNDELNSALLNNTEVLDNIFAKGAQEGFWNSEPVKRYKKALLDMNIPLEDINKQLNIVYDDLVNKGFTDQGVRQFDSLKESLVEVGISGETLNKVLPDVFGILQDPKLSRSTAIKMVTQAFIDAGDSASAAEKRAKDFFRITGENRRFKAIEDFNEMITEFKEEGLDPKQAEIASKKFIEGVRKGATNQQILESISDSIYEHTFKKGIQRGFSADAAATQAQIAADSIVNKIEQNSDRFKVTLVGQYDDTQMPQWIRDEMDARGNMTADQMARMTVQHQMSGSVKMDMPAGTDRSTPLYVYVTNQQTSGPGDNGGNTRTNPSTGYTEYWNGTRWIPMVATGGYIRRGTGGMIYGPGGPTEDLVPTMLSNGEYVIRAASVNKFGTEFFDMLNKGILPAMGRGGYSKYPSMVKGMGMGGAVYYNKGGFVNESSSNVEYNINVSVAGSNSSADEIAREVMSALDRKERMSKTVNRI